MDIETYANLPHLIMAADRVTRTWIDQALEKRGLRRRIAVTAPHPQAIPLLMGSKRLVSTVARSLVSPFIDDARLRLLPPPVGGTPHVFQMIWSARTAQDPALGWLRTAIRDSCLATERRQEGSPVPATVRRRARRGTRSARSR
jgi:DNA-binding transcriptional LysR family regulator